MTALSLMRLLPDGVEHSGGKAILDKVDLFTIAERDMRAVRGQTVAMIFQEPGLSLNPVMTIGDQIGEVLKRHLAMRRAAAQQRCIDLLDQVGIPDAARHLTQYPMQLSGGMKQRIMIAMALAGEPKLLVADEPTTALDVTTQAQVLELLREIQSATGMSLLLITHDLGVVSEMADDVGVMYAGQIVEQADCGQLLSRPLHPYTQKLLAALPAEHRRDRPLEAIPGAVPPLGSVIKGCRFAARCDRAWSLCRDQTPTWTVFDSGHGVRCHLYQNRSSLSESEPPPPADAIAMYSASRAFAVNVAPSPPILEVDKLRVHFPIRKGIMQRVVAQVRAVDDVSLEMARGRTLALVGESGCGKTTLGKALLQLIRPTSGRVTFEGTDLTALKPNELRVRKAAMQMVFQDPYASLNPKMRVAEILAEGMNTLHTGESDSDRQLHIESLLDQVGLAPTLKWRYPHEFSGGQRQRIAIARALAVKPKLLICDEPTSALDVSVQAQILNLLRMLQTELNLSYLFITHNLAVVEYLAHQICVMYLGRIVERGTAAEILHSPRHPYTQALLSAVPRINRSMTERVRITGDLPSPANPPKGCRFSPRCSYATDECRNTYPSESNISATHKVNCHMYPQVQG
jgi:peptide/nickel transport system ATP-binding protein